MTASSPTTDLDQLIHERQRLGIISALAVNDRLSFAELKGLLGMSDGNLSVHARKLEEAGYIEILKSFRRRRPLTEYQLTNQGRRALVTYLAKMEAIVTAMKDGLER